MFHRIFFSHGTTPIKPNTPDPSDVLETDKITMVQGRVELVRPTLALNTCGQKSVVLHHDNRLVV